MTLTDLASRVQGLTGPCRITDGLIFKALEERPGDEWTTFSDYGIWYRRDPDDHAAWDSPPDYTRSLDAAMASVPEGMEWVMARTHDKSDGDKPYFYASISESQVHYGHTPALALTAASLLARAASENSHG